MRTLVRLEVLVVDEQTLFREGVRLLLARWSDVRVHLAATLNEGVALAARWPGLRLMVLDPASQETHCSLAIERLLAAAPQARLLVLGDCVDAANILAALEAGAHGYLHKSATADEVVAALRQVLAGRIHLPSQLVETVAATEVAGEVLAPPDQQAAIILELGLSPRQVDVLRLLVAGLPTKVIARQLGLAESSVKSHLIGLFRRLDVSSRVQAVVAAAEAGLRFEA